ncbi:hypothetical protein NECAME_13130, partial [Necator americanus]
PASERTKPAKSLNSTNTSTSAFHYLEFRSLVAFTIDFKLGQEKDGIQAKRNDESEARFITDLKSGALGVRQLSPGMFTWADATLASRRTHRRACSFFARCSHFSLICCNRNRGFAEIFLNIFDGDYICEACSLRSA